MASPFFSAYNPSNPFDYLKESKEADRRAQEIQRQAAGNQAMFTGPFGPGYDEEIFIKQPDPKPAKKEDKKPPEAGPRSPEEIYKEWQQYPDTWSPSTLSDEEFEGLVTFLENMPEEEFNIRTGGPPGNVDIQGVINIIKRVRFGGVGTIPSLDEETPTEGELLQELLDGFRTDQDLRDKEIQRQLEDAILRMDEEGTAPTEEWMENHRAELKKLLEEKEGPAPEEKAPLALALHSYGWSLGDIDRLLEEAVYDFRNPGVMISGGQRLPEAPLGLIQALKEPYIQVTEEVQMPTGRLNKAGAPEYDKIPQTKSVVNPAIDVQLRIYQQQLEAQVDRFKEDANQKWQGAEAETQRDSDITRSIISATGGLGEIKNAAGDVVYSPEGMRDFQREMGRMAATGGLGVGPGETGFLKSSEAQQVQGPLFGMEPRQAVTTGRGLTPFELQMAELYPVQQQRILEEMQREELQRQFNEQLVLEQQQQQFAQQMGLEEMERQRVQQEQQWGLQQQQQALAEAQLRQQQQQEYARLFSDPAALATLTTLYGPGALPPSTQVFGSPFGTPQGGFAQPGGAMAASSPGVAPPGGQLPGTAGPGWMEQAVNDFLNAPGVVPEPLEAPPEVIQNWRENIAPDLAFTEQDPYLSREEKAAKMVMGEMGGMSDDAKFRMYGGQPAASANAGISLPSAIGGGGSTPWTYDEQAALAAGVQQPSFLTQPQFQQLTPFGQASRDAMWAQQEIHPTTAADMRRAVTPSATFAERLGSLRAPVRKSTELDVMGSYQRR